MSAPISSPVKVRQRKGRIWAEDPAGQVVVDGRTSEHWPERYVAQTASGIHRVSARVEAGPEPYLPVVDASGREVARVVTARRQDWVLRLVGGETATVAGRSNLLTPPTCTIGELAKAVAPRLAPQRYFTLDLSEAVLAHPDRDALITAIVWISESTIAGLIGDAGGGAD